MQLPNKTTVAGLFSEDNVFAVPAYQRAYTWGSEAGAANTGPVVRFVADLREQAADKRYFMGHFLFEKNPLDENSYWVIDGQQRLTTIVIFFCVLYEELKTRQVNGEFINDRDGSQLETKRIFEKYAKDRARIKFKTVQYDNAFFEQIIINESGSAAPDIDTRSKTLILAARDYFAQVMKAENTTELMRWSRTLANALVTTLEVEDKAEATQIFAFQNDRGLKLTDLEKLKAHLMHEVFLSAEPRCCDNDVKFVEDQFADIYKQIVRIDHLEIVKLDEDQILTHFVTAFIPGGGTTLDAIKNAIGAIKIKSDRVQWLKDFCVNLKNAFIYVEQAERIARTQSALGDVLILEAPASWPLILKLFHHHSADIQNCEELFRLMEITWFKLHFTGGYRAIEGMNHLARDYSGKRDELKLTLEYCSQNGFLRYWQFNAAFRQRLQGSAWSPEGRYLLWKYENALRKAAKDNPYFIEEYLNKYGRGKNLDSTIDHIAPQNPEGVQYPDEFVARHLHCLGNLVLMPLGKNSQLSNRPPTEKVSWYEEVQLASLKEVARTITETQKWTDVEIEGRKQKIVEFALDYWRAR